MFSKQFPFDRRTRIFKTKINSTISRSEDSETINAYNKPAILISDENLDFARALSKGLLRRGFSCYVTENKGEIFSLFLLKRPIVTVLGFNIGEKDDGIKAATDILRTSPRAEIVVLTNSIFEVTKTEKVGIELFVRRDLGLTEIIDAICVVSNLKKPTCKLVSR